MKSIIFFFALTALFVTSSNAQADYTVNTDYRIPSVVFNKGKKHDKNKTIAVSAGTTVTLQLTESINSDEVSVGQYVQLLVDMNVLQDGKIIIKSNAIALGRIKDIKKATINCRESITIEAVSVQAVDGQQIPLNGQEQTFVSPAPGQNLVLQPGKTLTGFFKNDEVIMLK